MGFDMITREMVIKKLASERMRVVESVLGSAVNREARIDLKLKDDTNEQKRLENIIRGLSIIYYFSFLQSHILETQWNQTKNPSGSARGNFLNVNWAWFDIFKYARDCFAHDFEGTLFPGTQKNTQYFLELIHSDGFLPDVSIHEGRVCLGGKAIHQCLQTVRDVLAEGEINV